MERKEQGFTIIELLVAMAILGLLIGLLIPGIGIVRRGARNTARRTSLQAIQSEIEEYYGTNKSYPAANDGAPTGITVASGAQVDSQFTVSAVTAAPAADAVTDSTFQYMYTKTGNSYTLTVYLEPKAEAYVLQP